MFTLKNRQFYDHLLPMYHYAIYINRIDKLHGLFDKFIPYIPFLYLFQTKNNILYTLKLS